MNTIIDSESATALEARISALAMRGVNVPDPRQVYIAPEVRLERICPGAVLHPGTRLQGSRTYIGPRCQVGSEGPATLDNAVFAADSSISSGFANEAVLLRGAHLGPNAHVRSGTILEEYASTAHCVGLKQTILMAFVTLGSLINFCDALMSGGRSAREHSSIGSGFIHFNFTPFGKSGDKATPSLFGDVVRGVFMREERVFVGGLSGVVGPQKIGFGSVTVAGQVIRTEVAENHIFSSPGIEMKRVFSRNRSGISSRQMSGNIEFIRQLFALRAWYTNVRLTGSAESSVCEGDRLVLEEATTNIEMCITERVLRLNQLRGALGLPCVQVDQGPTQQVPAVLTKGRAVDYFEWLSALTSTEVNEGQEWLSSVALAVDISELAS